MRLISEYISDDESETAKVYHRKEKEYIVIVKSDTGTHYSTQFDTIRKAENFAEDWITKHE